MRRGAAENFLERGDWWLSQSLLFCGVWSYRIFVQLEVGDIRGDGLLVWSACCLSYGVAVDVFGVEEVLSHSIGLDGAV